jgi:hypothetical protein
MKLINRLRTQHWYGLVSREFERLGITDWRILQPTGHGHPKLVARINGRIFKTPVPSTERGGGDHKYLVNRIRKFVEAEE